MDDVDGWCLAGNQIKQPSKGHDDKNQLSQCKELWLFWYGEKPETVKNLVSDLTLTVGSHCLLYFSGQRGTHSCHRLWRLLGRRYPL